MGGTERQLLILARELQSRGHAVRVLALRPSRRPFAAPAGIDLRILHAPRAHDPRCFARFVRAIRDFQPDVLHTFLFGFDFWANLAGRLNGIPCVVSSRRELAAWQTRRHRWFQNLGNLLADGVAANSAAAAEYACVHERFLDRGAVYTIPNAYLPRMKPGSDEGPFPPARGRTFVNVANFWPNKGHDLLVRAMARCAATVDASLWFVGEGPTQARVRDLASGLGLAERVHFLGRRHDVESVLARADLYVHASLTESSPNAVLEAMGQGIPVVAFACGGVPELLEGGNLGLLVKSGNGTAFAHAIEWGVHHPEETAAMGRKARAVALTRHVPHQIAEAYVRFYRSVSRRALSGDGGDARQPPIAALLSIGDGRQPSTRYRVLQFVPSLQDAGFRVRHMGLPTPSPTAWPGSLPLFLHAIRRRRDVRRAVRADCVLVQKALTPSRWRRLAADLGSRVRRFVLDLDDDVIRGPSVLPLRWPLRRFQDPSEAAVLLRHASGVIVGNAHLRDACASMGKPAEIIPTVLDCHRYWATPVPAHRSEGEPLRLVWTGQRSTLPFLLDILPALRSAAESLKSRTAVTLRVICDGFTGLDAGDPSPLRIERVPWRLDREIDDLVDAHVGLMPLRDDEWCRSKCGLKALQYMALQIPPIVSPVGVAADIVRHAVNGYHATASAEWVHAIRHCAQNDAERCGAGRRARDTVVREYSLRRWADAWVRRVTAPDAPAPPERPTGAAGT